MQPEQKQTLEEAFRYGLEGAVEIAERLLPFCHTVEDLIGVAKLALDNEGQLRLLLKVTQTQQVKR